MHIQITPKLQKHFKGYCSSSEVIMLFVYMKCRFSLSYRELEEIAYMRGAVIDHSTLQRWVKQFVPLIDKQVRKRKKPVNSSWCMDETYIKLNGNWIYLYRAVDSAGNTIEFLLRKYRDKVAARAFFRKAFRNNDIPKKRDLLFWIGSLLASGAQGYMLGRYIVGFDTSPSAYLFAVLSTVCVTAGYTLIGACWLIMKTNSQLQTRAVRWAMKALIVTAIGIVCVSIVNPLVSDRIFNRWFSYPEIIFIAPIPALAVGLMVWNFFVLKTLPRPNDRFCWIPFVIVATVFLFSFIGLAYSFYPYVIPNQLTVWEVASSSASLKVILIGTLVVLPAILLYTAYSYRVFWGKATSLRYE